MIFQFLFWNCADISTDGEYDVSIEPNQEEETLQNIIDATMQHAYRETPDLFSWQHVPNSMTDSLSPVNPAKYQVPYSPRLTLSPREFTPFFSSFLSPTEHQIASPNISRGPLPPFSGTSFELSINSFNSQRANISIPHVTVQCQHHPSTLNILSTRSRRKSPSWTRCWMIWSRWLGRGVLYVVLKRKGGIDEMKVNSGVATSKLAFLT